MKRNLYEVAARAYAGEASNMEAIAFDYAPAPVEVKLAAKERNAERKINKLANRRSYSIIDLALSR